MIISGALTCSNCGAPINRATMTCPYCKTQYSFPNPEVKMTVIKPGMHRIYAQTKVSNHVIAVAPEAAKDKTLTQLREQLADALLGYMKITTAKEWDFMGDSTIFRGEVIVLDPCLE